MRLLVRSGVDGEIILVSKNEMEVLEKLRLGRATYHTILPTKVELFHSIRGKIVKTVSVCI